MTRWAATTPLLLDNTNGLRLLDDGDTTRFQVTTAGVVTVRDSTGSAVITLDGAGNAEITGTLTVDSTGGIVTDDGRVTITGSEIAIVTSNPATDAPITITNSDIDPDDSDYAAVEGFVNMAVTDSSSNDFGYMTFGIRHDSNNQSLLFAEEVRVGVLIQNGGSFRYVARFDYDEVFFESVPIAISDGITAPSTVAGKAYIYVDTTSGDLVVKFGDGTTKTLATDT